jgi:hypothetical protein
MTEGHMSRPEATALRAKPTLDAGIRLTDHGLWDESARPLAPPATPDFPYSEPGQAISGLLLQVHDMLRGELDYLRAELAEVERGVTTAGEARAAIHGLTLVQHSWQLGAYCARYCRVVTQHHTIETGSVFPHLRRSDPALGPVVDRLDEEHLVIHGVIESLDASLVAMVGDGSTPPDEQDFSGVHSALDTLTDTLLSHLSYEEHQLVDPLARFGFEPGQVPPR